ncbi:DNA-3-methyladenine glycosylase family protein [Actinomycetospora sp. CA-053990]|uniref:DNA-3-methyladenine glycosylase family protein n=1 Tax=Actinomycetospora sp. CA-053990 TaxID=3239891 RepID=UPI003D89F16D
MPADRELSEIYARLGTLDAVLADLVRRHGRPDPFVWSPAYDAARTTFASLLLHVISQQISTVVAVQLFRRVEGAAGGTLDPEGVVGLGADRLRELGLSRAKATTVVGVAERHLAGTLDTDRFAGASDDEVTAALTAARGVGPWTAQMFLIHQLRRPDVLPAGDLGIRHAVGAEWPGRWQEQGSALPSAAEVAQLGRGWRPYRTYAAALLWASLRPAADAPLTASGRG